MLPILYSFRRCPYAMRARLALRYANIRVELREVVLRDKPLHMLDVSAKGEVPVLILSDGCVIDESLEIIDWALAQHDRDNWLYDDASTNILARQLISRNDGEFKQQLDRYKYADRYPEHTATYYRDQAHAFLQTLEDQLQRQRFLFSARQSLADICIFPFIRQFAFVDKTWFEQSEYIELNRWLSALLQWPLFNDIMHKYPTWKEGDNIQEF